MAHVADPTTSSCERATHGLSASKQAAWIGFLEAHSVVLKALEADLIANVGLQLSAFEVLSRVAYSDDGRLRMSDVARQALLSQSRVSRLVAELERRGLLERQPCASDTRVVYAAITDAGRALVDRVQGHHVAEIERRFFKELSDDEVEGLAELWPRVIVAAGGSA
jgi:DNA-binding MarR family transcriptional regulator